MKSKTVEHIIELAEKKLERSLEGELKELFSAYAALWWATQSGNEIGNIILDILEVL